MDMLIRLKRPVMLVGNAGTGKTVLINDKMSSLGEDYMVTNIPFNFYTTSEVLQRVLEKPLEKKAGRNFGPPGAKKLIYFIDDLNMPEVGQYTHPISYDQERETDSQTKGARETERQGDGKRHREIDR